jgi:hypothetical protein
MTKPYQKPFTYEECVRNCADIVGKNSTHVRTVTTQSMAFALSMAFNKYLATVQADIEAAKKS